MDTVLRPMGLLYFVLLVAGRLLPAWLPAAVSTGMAW
jgi:hypothetical protein